MANESVFGNPSIGTGQQHYGFAVAPDYPNPIYSNPNGTNLQDGQSGIPHPIQSHAATRKDWQSKLPHSIQNNFSATSQPRAHEWLPQLTVALHSDSRYET